MTPSPSDSTSVFAGLSDAGLCRHWRGRAQFTVVQNGFGDGAQVRQLWRAWQHDANAPERLHYLLIDPRLPDREQIGAWLELPEQLVRCWPTGVPGYHRLFLAQGRFTLTLVVGDVAACLPQLEARVDMFLLRAASFLEEPSLLKWLGRLAAPQARLFAEGALPLSLQQWRQTGFVAQDQRQPTPAVSAPRWQVGVAETVERRAIVIGAGLAGCAACENLAARGWQIDLIEQHAQPAQAASGNLAGIFMPSISRDDNPTARLTRAAFLFAQQVWARSGVFDSAREAGRICGVLQVARDAAQAQAFEQAARHWQYPADYAQYLSEGEASARLGRATGSGWFFPQGGWLRPPRVCEAMLTAGGERVRRHFQRAVASLRRLDAQWQVCDGEGQIIAQAPVVIVANGMQARHLPQAASLPLRAIRGQISHVSAASLPALPFVLCGDGYLTGAVDGVVAVGASYDQDDGADTLLRDTTLRLASHRSNLGKLAQLLREPSLARGIDAENLSGRVGFRCVSADRLPLIGALPDIAALSLAGAQQLREVPRQPQLHGLLAYASRGLIWAPLAAEILACHLEGEPAPLGKDLLALLDPARFALKDHRQAAQRRSASGT